MSVYWTEAALADLVAVQAYISRHSARYADAMVQRIINRTDSLTSNPLIGAVVPEYDAEILREVLEGPYRVMYRVIAEHIHVIAVIHAARTMPPDLPEIGE